MSYTIPVKVVSFRYPGSPLTPLAKSIIFLCAIALIIVAVKCG